MSGLTNLDVYTSIFNITEQNNKFELYKNVFIEFSFEELKDELEEVLNISDITPYHLQHEIRGPRIIQADMKLGLEKSSTVGYIILLLGYVRSRFRDFQIYLRIVVGLVEDDIQLTSKQQYNSSFVTHETTPGIYSVEGISESVYTKSDHEGTLKIEVDDISMKTKLILTRFGSTFGTSRVDDKSFINILLGF